MYSGDCNPHRRRAVRSALLRGVLAVALCTGLVGLPEARGDYIAEVLEGGKNGYIYIGKRRIKRQGLTGWTYGDLIIRDDKSVMYLIGRRKPRRGEVEPLSAQAREEMRRRGEEVESLGETSSAVQEPEEADVPRYDTRVVPYRAVEVRRGTIAKMVKRLRDETEAHIGDAEQDAASRRGMRQYIAMVDAYLQGRPSWTNTGETEVIAGRECTKYRVRLPLSLKLDVWMTEELGPGYTAGHMFAKTFNLYRGGVRPMEVLSEIPGFPMKLEGEYRNVQGRGTMRFKYEVLRLIETDLDEKEFDPRPGSRVYGGQLPGFGVR